MFFDRFVSIQRKTLAGFLFIALLLCSGQVSAASFGALGDSLSDEYLGTTDAFGTQTDLPALNWVQQLVQLRGADFGTLEMNPNVRREPRNEGYEHNWARAGATAGTAPIFLNPSTTVTNQATSLAPAITAGDVEIVSINIGHNDFFYRDYLNGFDQIAGNNPELFVLTDGSAGGYIEFEDSIFNSIFSAVDTVLTANPNAKVALSYLPPGTLENVGYIIGAMQQLNARLTAEVALRANPSLKLVDFYAWQSSRYDINGDFMFAGYTIAPDSKASLSQTVPGVSGPCDSAGNCATLAYALNLVAHDMPGGHPGTIMQGLIANEFLNAINPWLGTPISLLTDNEILGIAAVPEPGSAMLLGTGLILMAGAVSRRRDS